MKQSINSVNIEGIVSEINLREIDKTQETGKKYVAGEVVVQVADVEGKINMIPVGFISADTKKDGTPNQNYARLMQLKDYNSIASAGLDNATKVQIRNANLTENLFLPQNGTDVISTMKINSNFFTKINETNYTPGATFSVSAFILSMDDEIKNIDGIEQPTGRLIIQAAVVGYADKVEIFKFIAEKQSYIDFVKANWKVGDTVNIGGNVRFIEENVEVEQEVGFGEAEVRKFTKRVKELIITRGSAGPISEEEAYSEADIKKGLLERKQRMEEVKNKAKSTRVSSNNTSSNKGGFDF